MSLTAAPELYLNTVGVGTVVFFFIRREDVGEQKKSNVSFVLQL